MTPFQSSDLYSLVSCELQRTSRPHHQTLNESLASQPVPKNKQQFPDVNKILIFRIALPVRVRLRLPQRLQSRQAARPWLFLDVHPLPSTGGSVGLNRMSTESVLVLESDERSSENRLCRMLRPKNEHRRCVRRRVLCPQSASKSSEVREPRAAVMGWRAGVIDKNA